MPSVLECIRARSEAMRWTPTHGHASHALIPMDIHGCELDVFCYGNCDGINFGGEWERFVRVVVSCTDTERGTNGPGARRRSCTLARTVGSLCEVLQTERFRTLRLGSARDIEDGVTGVLCGSHVRSLSRSREEAECASEQARVRV